MQNDLGLEASGPALPLPLTVRYDQGVINRQASRQRRLAYSFLVVAAATLAAWPLLDHSGFVVLTVMFAAAAGLLGLIAWLNTNTPRRLGWVAFTVRSDGIEFHDRGLVRWEQLERISLRVQQHGGAGGAATAGQAVGENVAGALAARSGINATTTLEFTLRDVKAFNAAQRAAGADTLIEVPPHLTRDTLGMLPPTPELLAFLGRIAPHYGITMDVKAPG